MTLNHICSSNSTWCPYPCCAGKNAQKICGSYECCVCFKASFASSDKAKFWHQKLNIDNNNESILPINVFLSTNKNYWFNCGSHILQNKLGNITNCAQWCPYPCCSKISHKLCDSDKCKICFNNSFATSDKAKYWDLKLNNNAKPRDIAKCSEKKFWFNCGIHSFVSSPSNIINGNWCPYPCCNKSPKRLCDSDDCTFCFNASFATSDKAKYWNLKLNNGVKPRGVFKSSRDKYWFKCNKKYHPSFNRSLFELSCRNTKKQPWCPYLCCGKGRALCDYQNCKKCFNTSFASCEKNIFWHQELNLDDNDEMIKPRDVYKTSEKKYWFKCEKNHIFNTGLVIVNNGSWCPKCSKHNYSKIAIKWLNEMMTRDNIFIQHAENKGEYFIKSKNFKAFVDGYCSETNTVYEFQLKWNLLLNFYNFYRFKFFIHWIKI